MSLRSVSLTPSVATVGTRPRSIRQIILDLVVLTKPRITLLLLATTLSAMIVAGRGLPPVSTLLLTLLAADRHSQTPKALSPLQRVQRLKSVHVGVIVAQIYGSA